MLRNNLRIDDKIGNNRRVEAMKKILKIILVSFLLMSCTTKKEPIHVALPSEIKAMWFSYVDFDKNLKGLENKEIESKIEEIINNCDELDINTLFVHAVAFTDAYYDSKIYAKSSRVSDEIDYLKLFVEKAHEKGMHVEAWINPMRSYTEEQVNSLDETNIIKKMVIENSLALRSFEGRYYLNPAVDEARQLVLSIVQELIKNYEIDGIHMDDYFYPAKVDDAFDEEQFIASGEMDRSTFRKNQVNQLVSDIHEITQDHGLTFGISPSGNLEYSRDVIFGDVEAWIISSSIDYILPQIYWGYTNKTRPYLETLTMWNQLVEKSDVDLIVGLAAYKLGIPSKDSDQEEWNTDTKLLSKQIQDCKTMSRCRGYAFFSYHSLFTECNDIGLSNKSNLSN